MSPKCESSWEVMSSSPLFRTIADFKKRWLRCHPSDVKNSLSGAKSTVPKRSTGGPCVLIVWPTIGKRNFAVCTFGAIRPWRPTSTCSGWIQMDFRRTYGHEIQSLYFCNANCTSCLPTFLKAGPGMVMPIAVSLMEQANNFVNLPGATMVSFVANFPQLEDLVRISCCP